MSPSRRPLIAMAVLAVAAAGACLLTVFLVVVPLAKAPARAPVPVATFDPWSAP